MCRPVRCRTCERTTWAGCGLHVSQVRAKVPAEDWCAGHDAVVSPRRPESQGWLRRLFGHRSG